jgi:T5SS/PEP-CTERM-associated repeat protein
MPRPPLLKAEHAWWLSSLALILPLAFVPRLPAATVITGDVTPALPWSASTDPRIGNTGAGTLTIDAGSQLSSSTAILGAATTAMGTATITGAGSKWTTDFGLRVGDGGSGALLVEAGGQVTNVSGLLAGRPGSSGMATITGIGSKWTNSNALSVGEFGDGMLRVEAGGQVSSSTANLGLSAVSTGTVTISGAGSAWNNSSNFALGGAGKGALRVEGGGQLTSSTALFGVNTGASGFATITGAGSKWTNSSSFIISRAGTGVLTITAGGLVSVRGSLTIDSNGGGSFINLTTGGMLALWGDADDSLAQFLDLVAGTDAIRYWNAGLANWSPLTIAMLGVDYALQYHSAGELTGYTLLTVLAPGPPGDFDSDGRVDGADFLAWQRGNSPTPNSAEDLATWRANLGLGAATPAANAIPEPGTLALVALAVAGLLPSCRSTRARQR